MNVEGSKEFAAPRERVWAIISDPAGMASLMPGVEGFEVIDDTHWRAKVKVPLGLGGLKMTMDFEQIEERPLEFASMRGKGKGMGEGGGAGIHAVCAAL
ncbi:MAG TPA: SRPBCC domain-containing protein, partial [Terriglobales bacterium]|nr:SRPBCC domain-containing protein [Terriglobales bacterium]